MQSPFPVPANPSSCFSWFDRSALVIGFSTFLSFHRVSRVFVRCCYWYYEYVFINIIIIIIIITIISLNIRAIDCSIACLHHRIPYMTAFLSVFLSCVFFFSTPTFSKSVFSKSLDITNANCSKEERYWSILFMMKSLLLVWLVFSCGVHLTSFCLNFMTIFLWLKPHQHT